MHDLARQWVDLLHETGCSERVILHCVAVHDAVMEYHRESITDLAVLEAGALLHDIGRSITHGTAHAQAGAGYCRGKMLPEPIVRIIECHLGAGLTADECTLLRLQPIDCMPGTIEEKIVAHADNLVSGDRTIHIEERMMRSFNLPRHLRKRLYHLWIEMETFRRSPIK